MWETVRELAPQRKTRRSVLTGNVGPVTTPHRPTPSATRRNEASRRAILAAAFDLLQEVGYAKLSIEGIAARAGVGKQTIYRWWPSKGAVIFDAFLMLSEGGEGEPPTLPDSGDLEADLTAVLHATVAELTDPRTTGRCARWPPRSRTTPNLPPPTANGWTDR